MVDNVHELENSLLRWQLPKLIYGSILINIQPNKNSSKFLCKCTTGSKLYIKMKRPRPAKAISKRTKLKNLTDMISRITKMLQ